MWWTAFQTKLGIAGFVAVILSLIFTGWAAVAAGKAARAAEASVRSDRAWLTFGDTRLHQAHAVNGDVGSYVFTLSWNNTGRSPAVNCTGYVQFEAVAPDTDIRTYVYGGPMEPFQLTNGGPGIPLLMTRPVPMIAFEMLSRGECILFLYSRIEYNDIFHPDRRHSEACLRVEIAGDFRAKVPLGETTPPVFALHVTGSHRSAN